MNVNITNRELMLTLGTAARTAARLLALAPAAQKNEALMAMAAKIRRSAADILSENQRDLENAKAKELKSSFLDRLTLNEARLDSMAKGLEEIAALPDPVGQVMAKWTRPNGLEISRVRVPIGVIGIVYESRPNVTADAGGLCLKSGNAAILRGGSDSFHSSAAIIACLQRGLDIAGLPRTAIQMVPNADRDCVGLMLEGLGGTLDLIVPRGGKSLVARVQQDARVPVFSHLEGICHVYVDRAADTEMAKSIVLNAKMRRTGICGSAETILIDRAGAVKNLKPIISTLIDAGCEVRGDEACRQADDRVKPATEQDWSTEYLDAIVSMKLVDGVEDAMAHIARYGSQHTESIVTKDQATAERFLKELDSAIVLHNASTQFADGGEFGFGAEIGIATGKLHARGPVGVEQLTTFKYQVRGTRADPPMICKAPVFGEGQRIGLFGGSFNPAHHGHYMVALYALKRLELDWVWWMVSPQNPLKDPSETGEYAARLAYTKSIARHPRFIVTDIEKQMASRTTAETLRGLKPFLARGHFVWIMGADSFANLHRWHDWLQIADTLPLAVLARPGFSLRALGGPAATRFSEAQVPTHLAPRLVGTAPPAWCFIPMPLRPESSTAIRRRAKMLHAA